MDETYKWLVLLALALAFAALIVAMTHAHPYANTFHEHTAAEDAGNIKTWQANVTAAGEARVELPNADTYCEDWGFDPGTYGGPKMIEPDMLSITCHPEQDGTWTTYYFNLNMERIDTKTTTTR